MRCHKLYDGFQKLGPLLWVAPKKLALEKMKGSMLKAGVKCLPDVLERLYDSAGRLGKSCSAADRLYI